ncbi:MAG: ribosome silencing factor [Candidatus Omnitrophica bacterium]|nr:ribosome silencing factor [Candidatus Omnitrophota bacterium]
MDTKRLLFFIREKAEDKKALDATALDMRKVSNLCDYFFICAASSTRHAKAIADGIMDALKLKGVRPWHVEGYSEGQWILLDYNTVVAHIFYGEARSFYNLERLWGDAPRVDFCTQKKARCKKSSRKKKFPA